jgi:hypothetical protein
MVPAAPSDPYSATWSCEGWHEAVDAVVLVVAGVVVLVVVVVRVVVVVVDVVGVVVGVDVRELGVLLVHAPRRDPKATATTAAAARTGIGMVHSPSVVLRACQACGGGRFGTRAEGHRTCGPMLAGSTIAKRSGDPHRPAGIVAPNGEP